MEPDFLTVAQALMTLREKIPEARYRFEGDVCVVEFWVAEGTPKMFDQAAQMFAPIE